MSSSRAAQRARYDRATADLDPPFAIVDLDAFDANSAAMVGRAAGKPLRMPSKSVRVRALMDRALAQPGWQGVMAFTLPEALWLAEHGTSGDVLVAYPTADRAALHRLATDEKLAATVTVMVDSPAQLDLIDAVVPAGERAGAVRVCIDLDASWRPARGVHIGVRRSPCTAPARPATSPPRSPTGPGSAWSG
ncbi:hypothetical protein GCM10027610_127060 [Dactylosporangium cerinum]